MLKRLAAVLRVRAFFWLSLAVSLSVSPAIAYAKVPPPRNMAYPGTLQLEVDARNIGQRIFQVRELIPARPGPLTLLYPQWIPGDHAPTGPIDKLAGLLISAAGKPLPWTRDPLNVYAFHVRVPAGVTQIEARFQFLSSQRPDEGRIMMTPQMLSLQWDKVSLYPAGVAVRKIQLRASVKLPHGWQYGSALDVASQRDDTVYFQPIDYDDLVDSPLLAGKFFQKVDLAPGAAAPVYLDIAADAAQDLAISPAQLQLHRNLVQQMYKLYGTYHYDHYDFLLALSDKLGEIGLEHHRSSEDSAPPGYFTQWEQHAAMHDLLPHEFNHSWNGKFRRGTSPHVLNFNKPVQDSLLWVYEGQTQFWGDVLAARAGLWSPSQARAMLAYVAALYDKGRPGQKMWRSIQDTTNDPIIAQRAPLPYRTYQMSEDYYAGGQLIWLDVDGKLRELTHDQRCLDDFAKAFFGIKPGQWGVATYTFHDVIKALNTLAPYDWSAYLRQRLDGHGDLIGGLAAHGWRLVYNDQATAIVQTMEANRGLTDLTYSLGLVLGQNGQIADVLWDGPAFKAGLAPAMQIVTVNGKAYSAQALKDAVVAAAKDPNQNISLVLRNFDEYQPVMLAYHQGLKYPHLQRIEGKPDTLSELLQAR